MTLPSEWRLLDRDNLRTVLANREGAELEATLRPVREVENLPQSDPASRDAARLQRDHEDLFGRPAQAATVASLSDGAKRWTATWVDGNLPSASHEMTLDTVIVPLSEDWLLELSLSQVEAPATYEALLHTIFAGIEIAATGACTPDRS